jgi:hypothetical protein
LVQQANHISHVYAVITSELISGEMSHPIQGTG